MFKFEFEKVLKIRKSKMAAASGRHYVAVVAMETNEQQVVSIY